MDESSRFISSPRITGMPKKSDIANRTEYFSIKIESLLEQIDTQEEKAEEIRQETETLINLILADTADGARQRELLHMRFIDGLTFPACARALFGTDGESQIRRTTRLHGRALLTFAGILERKQECGMQQKT